MSNKTILIAEDDPGLLAALKTRCRSLGVSVRTASNGTEALHLLSKKSPDLLILDINMPAADGISVCEKLLADPARSPVPVIFFSGRSDPETIRRCEALGAHYVVKDTNTWARLNPLIQDLLRDQRMPARPSEMLAAASRSPLVLCIDRCTAFSDTLKTELRPYGVEVLTASNGMHALSMAQRTKPDVIITDHAIREGESKSLLVRLKNDPLLKFVPVIVLAEPAEDGGKDVFLEHELLGHRGAAGFLTKPVDLDALLEQLRRHVKFTTKSSRPGAIPTAQPNKATLRDDARRSLAGTEA